MHLDGEMLLVAKCNILLSYNFPYVLFWPFFVHSVNNEKNM